MNRLIILLLLLTSNAVAATPTLVQSFWTEYGGTPTGTFGSGNINVVTYPEPTTSGNLLVCYLFSGTVATFTIADDQSETWTVGGSNFPFTSASNNTYYIWYKANNVGSVRKITFTASINQGTASIHCAEFFNVAQTTPVDGTPNCHTVTSTTATGVTTGTLTTGDLLFFVSANDNATAIASFTAGSQSNITWILDAADRLDGYAGQYGVYNSTTAFIPQMTTGTSQPFTSCQIVFKSASAGSNNSQSMRILGLGHYAFPGSGTTQTLQVPTNGNLVVLSFTGGGDCIANSGNTGCATTGSVGITSTPSNTWACTGSLAGSHALTATSQICYAANASVATTMTIAVTRNLDTGGALTQDTILAYDITGAATSPFDNDASNSGTQSSLTTSFTTCSSCLSPGTSSGIILANGNWNFGTATTATAPSGLLFDSAFTHMNLVNGPQPFDQNGGWLHFYNTNTSSETVTWTLANDGTNAPGGWAGRIAHFKAPAAGGPPPGQFPRIQ